jgi:RiboL-PSP-HEPN
MPSIDEVHADVESDRSSREGEIRLIERLSIESRSEAEKQMLRRSLIILTYAHLEGFTKFVLYAYATTINAMNLDCATAAIPIAAASLNRVFAALRDPQSKHDFFRSTLPDDAKLHLAAREQSFISEFERAFSIKVSIPDSIIDTKSNLSPDILRKLLFQLGLPYHKVDEHQATISRLLGVRNAIAHGDRLLVPEEGECKEFIVSSLAVMTFLQGEIFSALYNKSYLRAVAVV